jgi:hypothetical protein
VSTILIDPHGDDAALFASFLCLRHKPLVVVTHLSVPWHEVDRAMAMLGYEWTQTALEKISSLDPDLVIAPVWEKEGLPEHNLVANYAMNHLPTGPRYLTYAGHPRQKSRGREVEFEPEWIWAKLRALAAFESQAATPSYIHFLQDLREYVA